MNKYTKKWCSAILSAATLLSMFGCLTPAAAEASSDYDSTSQTFEVYEDEKGIRFNGPTGDTSAEGESTASTVIGSVSDYYEIAGQNGVVHKGDTIQKSADSLPASVDNSQSEFFPEIGNQGSLGSCTCWAQTYYQFTYTMNKEMNVTTTPENTFSPKWTYNLGSTGNDTGSGDMDIYTLMKEQGNVPMSLVPYDGNYTSWSPEEEIWKTSIKYRIKDYQTFSSIGNQDNPITSVDDEDLAPIKAALSNGDVLAFSTYINSWVSTQIETNPSAPENDKYVDEYIVTSQSGTSGGHRMTLVGYNDNIWTDINGNGSVDDGEMGALKIANSWGADYANDGFIWLAYDALNKESCVEGVAQDSKRDNPVTSVDRIDVLPYNTGSSIYLKYTLNTADRTQLRITINAEKDGSSYSFLACPPKLMFSVDMNPVSFDGTTNANDGTMIIALDNVVPGLTSKDIAKCTWTVTFTEKNADGTALTVKNVEIIDENTNTSYKPENAYPFSIDGEDYCLELTKSNSQNIAVYYRGYDNPKLHYKLNDGEWNSESGVAMSECYETRGYTHKYIIETDNPSEAILYFSDANGNIDDNNGQYFTAVSGLNYYITENARDPMTVELSNDFNSYIDRAKIAPFHTTVSGGYPQYMYQYTYVNLDTGEETVYEYTDKADYTFNFSVVGTYKVTVNVKDFSDEIATAEAEITVADIPFEFTEFTVTPSEKITVGQELNFFAETQNEAVISRGPQKSIYTFVIKKDGKECYTTEVNAKTYHLTNRTSTIVLDWTPTEAGSYSITISSTDDHKEYAERTINFKVIDCIIGDADSNGEINMADALLIQLYDIKLVADSDINLKTSDCNVDEFISLRDASCVQRYIAGYTNCGETGAILAIDNPEDSDTDTDTSTDTTTDTDSDTDTEETNTVTFANALNWGGTISCYYWSDSNKTMTTWPGVPMTNAGTNNNNQTLYTFEVPDGATYVIFSNGSSQTVDIPYGGGEVRYYPLSTTDSQGHHEVETW